MKSNYKLQKKMQVTKESGWPGNEEARFYKHIHQKRLFASYYSEYFLLR